MTFSHRRVIEHKHLEREFSDRTVTARKRVSSHLYGVQ